MKKKPTLQKLNWRKEYSELFRQWKRMHLVAKKQIDDKHKVLRVLHEWSKQGKFKNEKKTFIKQFNRIVKILQS